MAKATTKKTRKQGSDSLTSRQILSALRSLKRGQFDARLPEDYTGINGEICSAFNDLAQQLGGFGDDLSDLNQAVGAEGRTGRRLKRGDYNGDWTGYVVVINQLLDSLTSHTDEMARVINAVAQGDLTQRIEIDGADDVVAGMFLKHARGVNDMVEQLGLFGNEVTRVAREVGVNGKLGAQADVPGVSGVWKELTDNVNSMASNLTAQVREIARVTTAVAQGDLTKSVNMEVKGEILELKNTINTMVDRLGSFADEVSRVAREVGTEGRLGGQANVQGVSGVWHELTQNVNSMADNLTQQVRNIANVATSIAKGDLSKKITVDAQGEILELKDTINTMVDQLSSFGSEVSRVAREVGTEGRLGGQAEVKGVSGAWKELTDNVNLMADNLTDQVRNVAEVVTAIAEGDLSKKITVDAQGEILALKETVNSTVDRLNDFSSEVTRVALLVGTEGTLGVEADVRGVSGIWKELTSSVNTMGRNLTNQVRDIAQVTTAVANGDLSRKITVQVKGELLELKETINAMVDSLSSFADEVTRVSREVGSEGILGGQAQVNDVSGVWKELTDNVNGMAVNLTDQVRSIADVASAVAAGDLSKTIKVEASGEMLELKQTLNNMVEQLGTFASEVTRVSREVGVEGLLGGQAVVEGAKGTWLELTKNVNQLSSNLTMQVRDIADVTTAVAQGDLTRKITVNAQGEILSLKNTINTMVDQLSRFGSEVTKLATEVGVDGKLGGEAEVRGVSGTWRDLTDAVNSMAANLTGQVRNISQVASAIADGDLSKKIVVDAQGEILELKNTINKMVDQLSNFAAEVTQVARDVGTEGKLGGQASVEGVKGTWKELTDNVNLMGSNLTHQVRDIARVAGAIAGGDLQQKVTVEVRGELLDLKKTINTMVDQLSDFADEVTRVARDVGVEGKLGGQAEVKGVSGTWKELTDNVNMMADNLTNQVRDIATVTTAVATGDLSRKITVEVKGEILELKNTINTMVDQLSSFAAEVTRVSREVGTEGTLGGQAQVKGVSGTWRELTDTVNVMADNLTEQVRGIARVVTAVADGDLNQTLQLEAKGEIATLVSTINNMIGTLSVFAEQVTGVAHDVGVEGRLGGQADVPGAAGVWRDLTNNVNELAGNLTRQVRSIGDVVTAVATGDLTEAIEVDARGEVALLKDNVNQMIEALRHTTKVNQEQDWLKTNLARFTRMLQGQRDLLKLARMVLNELADTVTAQHGAFYLLQSDDDTDILKLFASYAYKERKHVSNRFDLGEGLVGQAAVERKRILVSKAPDDYIQISSSLGEAAPNNLVVVPILFEDQVKGVIELATFDEFSENQLSFLDELVESLGIVIATIEATMRTDKLLRQSQGMAEELQTQQEELRQTNEELEEKAKELSSQKSEVEAKNRQVELARQELEEKAEQLALTSKYKSQFLANMSHELRTPLNSLLILSQQLKENRNGNLDDKQIQFAETINQAGSDLLALINEILDLARIESGTISIDVAEVSFKQLEEYVERSFEHIAREKDLEFRVALSKDLGKFMTTDEARLKQVLRNLLSNAIKFTSDGSVSLVVHRMEYDEEPWVAFAVSDTGIGIAGDKHQIIFESFQQADGSTSRNYGGTGLGLAISREIAFLLGGEIQLQSEPGQGSTFTLLLPMEYQEPDESANDLSLLGSRAELSVDGEVDADESNAEETSEDDKRPAENKAERKKISGPSAAPRQKVVHDDRNKIESGDRVLLIVEDDPTFASTLLELGREQGFRGVVALSGNEAWEVARTLKPDAITLDLHLPDIDGWVLLDRLKHDGRTRHIPVHVISGFGDEKRARDFGAVSVVNKPAKLEEITDTMGEMLAFLDRKVKRLLVVEDDDTQREAILQLIGNGDVKSVAVATAEQALEALDSDDEPFDCMVLDLNLPEMDGFELIRAIKERPALRRLPIVVYTGKELSSKEQSELDRLAETVIVKDVRSPERLLDETALFLHRVEANLPEEKRKMLQQISHGDPALKDKHVLVVDDDMRNIFAITAVLEDYSMRVLYAENGKEALETLGKEDDIDIVLMDIMMPEMDGYEATRKIRESKQWANLPVIALTAKAMPEDREKCIQAGASDYVTKPVDPSQLISLLRVWLYR